jgi:putative SbcD/Mre11-related phosphoesterase
MKNIKMQPVIDEAVLRIIDKKILIIADIHIGIEYELRELGLNISSQTNKIIDRLKNLCEKFNPKDIILLGDIKHNIPSSPFQERRDVKKLFDTIREYGNIHIIPGNHDGNISKISSDDISIHSSSGFKIHDIGFSHGHRWPKSDILDCEYFIMAHTHPKIMLTDRLNYKTFEPCWLKAEFSEGKFRDKFKIEKMPDVFIMPAFNHLCGGIAVNKEGIVGPIGKIIDINNAKVFLLDGTFLGKVNDIK